MNDTTTNAADQDLDSTAQHVDDLRHVDPKHLVIGVNVRLDSATDKTFLASVRERGVLVPVVAHPDIENEGRLTVLYGQRRTLAAVQTGRATIPVYVVASPQQADRIIDQLVENDHRAHLATTERVAAFEQLAGLGLSAAQIAKRTATKRGHVDAALTVSGSALAKKATARWDFLTLDQAVVLAEFDDDPETVTALVAAAQTGRFDHVAQRARDDRAEKQAYQQAVEALGDVQVIDRPGYDSPVKTLGRLVDHDGTDLDPDVHTACPGHAVYLTHEWRWANNDDTSDVDDEDLDEQEDGDDGDDEAGQWVWVTHPVCTDPATNGHPSRYGTLTRTGADSQPDAEVDPEQAAQAAERAKEQARAARRDVIASNKAWDSAQTVRRQWIVQFLTRKTPPKGTAAFIAVTLATHSSAVDDFKANDILAEFLGTTPAIYGHQPILPLIDAASEARAQVLALAVVLAGYEARTGRHSWRSVDRHTDRYLTFLDACGYTLSDVEVRATQAGIPGVDDGTTRIL